MDKLKRLPDGELGIMQLVWRMEPPVSRAMIEERQNESRPLATTTILTFLLRLCEKGFLSAEKRGNTNYYTPLVSERDYLAFESRGMLDRLFGGSVTGLAASLCDGGISREEVETLRKLLEEGTL